MDSSIQLMLPAWKMLGKPNPLRPWGQREEQRSFQCGIQGAAASLALPLFPPSVIPPPLRTALRPEAPGRGLRRSASRRPRCRWRAASAGGSSGAGPERRQTPVGRCGAACTRVSLWCGWDTVLRQVGAGGETQLFVKANRKCWWIRC